MSLVREAMILNNVVIIKKSIKASYVLNSGSPHRENIEIQRLLQGFSNYLENKLKDLFNYMYRLKFLEDSGTVDSYQEWLNEIKKTQEGYYRKGLKILNKIITELDKRTISASDYKLLSDIILNQRDIATKILDKEIHLSCLEEMTAYIKDVPSYLKLDLKIEFLPYLPQKTEVEINEHNYLQFRRFYNIA